MKYPRCNRYPKGKRKSRSGHVEQNKQASILDNIKEFEKFRLKVLPMLQGDMFDDSLSAEEMYSKYAKHAAAMGINIALSNPDSTQAIAMIKDILDRTQGRAVQREETTHKYDGLTDDELDAMVTTKLRQNSNGKK